MASKEKGKLPAPPAAKRKIVVKRRKTMTDKRKSAAAVGGLSSTKNLTRTSRRGLPAISPAALAEAAAAAAADQEETQDDPFASSLACNDLPCDTLMVIRGLQQQQQPDSNSIPIPLSSGSMLLAVLECQVHARLRQSAALEELQNLLDAQEVIRLRAATGDGIGGVSSTCSEGLSVLLTRQDYMRGVRDAQQRHAATTTSLTDGILVQKVVDWFIQHFKEWAGRNIRREVLQDVLEKDPVVVIPTASSSDGTITGDLDPSFTAPPSQRSIDKVLEVLQNMQVLLPSRQHRAYQLWLPEWGTVLKAWQKAQTNLLANLKRSYHGERSVTSLNQPYSPIPTGILMEWLKTQGIVYEVERPSGTFLRLADHYEKKK